MAEPLRYCDWCKSRLAWDPDKGYWACTNPDCRWNAQGDVADYTENQPKRPKD